MTNIQRVGMINSNNTQRNSDHDFTKLWKRILGNKGGVESKEQFVFDNDTKKLSAGSDIATAYILCTRPASNPIPNQKFLAQFEFTGSLDFLNIINGDKIFIEIKENLVNDPTLIEDLDSQTSYNQGLGIGEIKIAKNYPSHSNFLKLYEWNEGQLVDLRKAISLPAIDEVAQRTDSLESKMESAEGQISQLVEAGTPSYLGITGIVGEKYTENNILYEQRMIDTSSATSRIAIGSLALNKYVHLQAFGSGQPSKKIKLKMKKFGAPTTNVIVEIRKGVKVDVSEQEAYRYGGEVVASTTIAYTEFTTERKEFTLTLNNQFGGTKGELLDIVVYQQGGIVNKINYYQIACNNSQFSDAFAVIYSDGESFCKHKITPFYDAESLSQTCFVKKIKKEWNVEYMMNIPSPISYPVDYAGITITYAVDIDSLSVPDGLKSLQVVVEGTANPSFNYGVDMFIKKGNQIIKRWGIRNGGTLTWDNPEEGEYTREIWFDKSYGYSINSILIKEIYAGDSSPRHGLLYPIETKNIGECANLASYGRVPWRKGFWGLVDGTINPVTLHYLGRDSMFFGGENLLSWGKRTIALSGEKQGSGTENYSFYNPQPTVAKVYSKLEGRHSSSNYIANIGIKIGGISLGGTLNTESRLGIFERLEYLLLPEGKIDVEVYAWHYGGDRVKNIFKIEIQ